MKHVVIQNQHIHAHVGNSNVYGGKLSTTAIDVSALERDLRSSIQGEVRFSDGDRALYATDASNYRQMPIGIVIPKDEHDVIQTIALCRRYGAPILSRGGGTSQGGQSCNIAVIIDMSKYMNRVLELDPERKIARVQPGTILDDLRNAAERYHLTYGPDPSTHDRCTLGGMIGNDSCGTHSQMSGKTVDNVEELDILTYDGLRMRVGKTSDDELERIIQEGGRKGEIYARLKALRDKYADLIRARYPNIPRRVSGYHLDQLLPENGFNVARALVGTEGTCVTVLEATTRLINSPRARTLLVLGYPDIYQATDHISEILAHQPIALEGMDNRLIENAQKLQLLPKDITLLPPGGGWLLVEFGNDTHQQANDAARKLMEELQTTAQPPNMKLFENPKEAREVWALRESATGATGHVPGEPDAWSGWEDAAVPPDKVGDYLREFTALLVRYGYRWAFYGHFGQGCIHNRISFDLATSAGIQKFRAFIYEAADLVLKYGGSLSGEHGDGQARAELLPKMFGDELIEAFREFKSIWDPDWKMNPGKVVNAYAIDENLRLGANYAPKPLKTRFAFVEDDGSLAQSTLRCVGVGKCRHLDGGTMCPSFMVTREEKHSTRGRARLLFEMLQGNPLRDGWKSEAVKESLDLCLACKGCKSDCPVRVDMATYKAEFLSHYYEGKLRPITGYSLGWIYWWSRLASFMPGMVNFVTHTPGLRTIAKAVAGIAPQREVPAFASQTFKQWFKQRATRNIGSPRVMLWPDTFNNHFHPEIAIAAVEVLEAAGFQVIVPEQSLCCGRPLYDYGFLDMAQHLLQHILDTLQPQIEDGIPLVGLEPSCVAVFRDELLNILPHDENAKRLARQSYLLSEFLEQKVEHYQPPKLQAKAIVHGHCHHKAIMKMKDEQAILTKLGLDYTMPDTGCCGMAGSFGFEQDHYDVSLKVGERVLLPAVRKADKKTLIIADGFSCREQIAQTTDRQALHLAQVLQMALHEQAQPPTGDYPEKQVMPTNQQRSLQSQKQLIAPAILLACGAAISSILFWMWRKQRQQK